MRIPMALLVTCVLLSGQVPEGPDPTGHSSEIRLPNGKLQRDEIVKAEYQKSLEDAAELIKLSEELKADLEKNSAFVVSIPTIKRTEEIEKLAKRIRSRMKRG